MFFKSMLTGIAVAIVATGSAYADCTLPADATNGKMVSNQCKSCHVFEADKPSRPTGPNLHDVYGEKAGTRKDFPSYSPAIIAANAKGLTWADDKLDAYLTDPKAMVPGNKMAFPGLKNEQDRRNVIAYLSTLK